MTHWFVYILKCFDDTYYVGCTNNVEGRFGRHMKAQVHYTRTRPPVELINYTAFPDKYKAYKFEKYLKSGSGRAFAKRHLI